MRLIEARNIEDVCELAETTDGAIAVWCREPMSCRCGTVHYIGVNRDGQTRCIECDEQYRKQRALETNPVLAACVAARMAKGQTA